MGITTGGRENARRAKKPKPLAATARRAQDEERKALNFAEPVTWRVKPMWATNAARYDARACLPSRSASALRQNQKVASTRRS